MDVVRSDQEAPMATMRTNAVTHSTAGFLGTVALVLLVPLAVAFPAAVVVVGLAAGVMRGGRWFAHALREADDRARQLAPAYADHRRR
jgi:hypothetical protein